MKLRIDGRIHEVDTQVEADRVRLVVDGRVVSVGWRRDADGVLTLEQEGRRFRAAGEGSWVVVDGRARSVERVIGAAAEVLPDRVTPPMPAVVVKVLVAEGDEVARGDRLVVVSAMKTETALKAPRAGRVLVVRCVVGQNVRPGEELILLSGPD